MQTDNKEVAVIEPESVETAVTQFGNIDPQATIAKASAVADALATIVKRHPKMVVKVEGKDYPTVECWTTMGAMLGVFPFVEWTKESGQWNDPNDPYVVQARVQAKTASGQIIGAGEAVCRSDETLGRSGPRWRDAYAVFSMAQTRAISKALRMPLGWVLKLAGMEATPAEEVPPQGFQSDQANTPAGPQSDAEESLLAESDMKALLISDPSTVDEDRRRAFVWTAAMTMWNNDRKEAETQCRAWGTFTTSDNKEIRGPLPWDISRKDGSLSMKGKWLNRIWDTAKQAYSAYTETAAPPKFKKAVPQKADDNTYRDAIANAAMEISGGDMVEGDELILKWIKDETKTEQSLNAVSGFDLAKVKARSDEELNRYLNHKVA